ncbi:probable 2-oxoglutarate-dependent dioxygenase AOP1 [Quercus lobata]|uniref:probable 2-oxoglutarate-dependent dioxygenase AOP1 n=1 Tax=Quercus lobata TaxID=97700 RepID=UPI0012481C40|nr:probable 2-oxoglutarate-dependent dioxygenase AOP1 [Quercus lobata]
MAAVTPHKIPVVDLSIENMKPGTSAWYSARKDVQRALEECGSFVAVYDKVPLELHKTMFAKLEELFNLPHDTKIKNTSDKPYFGYYGQISILPLYECMGIDNPITKEGIESFTNLMWPAGNELFSESTHLYAKLVEELYQMVIRMVFESYGVGDFETQMESTTVLLRCLKYRAPQLNETNRGLRGHTDKNFLSILHQNHVGGLEIKVKDEEWVTFESTPSSFLFLAGDGLMAWSNERIRSPYHQVMLNGKENTTRYSLGYFALINGVIQTPEELVDDEHPLKYKPFDQFEFLRFDQSEEGQKSKSSIKDYCGV